MRAIVVLLLAVAVAAPALAQEPETLISGGVSHGGFGGPAVRFTRLSDQLGVMVGGHGGWIIGHSFVIGGGGYGLAGNNVDMPYTGIPGGRPYLTFGYAGVELQYIIRPMKLVHYSVSALIGGGSARCRAGGMWVTGTDDVFIAEPGASVILNLTRSIRLDLGVAYRFASGVDIPWMANEDLSGPSGILAVGFGHF